jgi:predicted rRNA methylase YqxC with S4 and FtsJ domains
MITYQKNVMDKLKKFELMEKVTRELEDLKNSQTAIVQKITKIEVDNFDLSNKTLDRILPVMHQNLADNLDKIAEILESFEEAKDDYSKKNNIDELREQETIREVTGSK